MSALNQLFEQFLRERTYVHNVTPKTLDWYQSAWHAFKHSQPTTPTEITKADLLAFVVHLRERGVKPVSCNTWLRAMNAFCRWLGCRMTELLTASVNDFDFDNLLLTVYGKGRKERRVPMSFDLRRILFRFGQVKDRAEITSPLMFPTRDGGPMAPAERATELLLPDETPRVGEARRSRLHPRARSLGWHVRRWPP